MEEYIMEIMKRTSVFMILAQAVIHFRPNPSYEKYFKFLVGIMTIVILVIPLLELLHSDIGIRYKACMNHYTETLAEMTEDKPELAGQIAAPGEIYLEEIGQEICAKLEEYASEQGYRIVRVSLSDLGEGASGEGEDKDGYRVRIQMSRGTEKEQDNTDITIEEIRIREEKTGAEREAEAMFQTAFASILEVKEDRLEVEIIE